MNGEMILSASGQQSSSRAEIISRLPVLHGN